jgi:hypothetical protein
MFGLEVVAKYAHIGDWIASISPAIYSYVDGIASGIVHRLVEIAIHDIVANSNQFHVINPFDLLLNPSPSRPSCRE